jgi:hypothetical protein
MVSCTDMSLQRRRVSWSGRRRRPPSLMDNEGLKDIWSCPVGQLVTGFHVTVADPGSQGPLNAHMDLLKTLVQGASTG